MRWPSAVTATASTPPVWPSRVRSRRPLARSHTRTVQSPLPETMRWPSAVTATAQTAPVWPSRVRSRRPLARSHTRTVPSSPPETMRWPSAVTATALTQPVWPSRVRSRRPLARFHTRTVLSPPPETMRWPSAVTATAPTQPVWPSRVRSRRPLARSHTRTVPSSLPETMRWPSAVTATALTSVGVALQDAFERPAGFGEAAWGSGAQPGVTVGGAGGVHQCADARLGLAKEAAHELASELVRVAGKDVGGELQCAVDRVDVGWAGSLMGVVGEQVADAGDRELAFQPREVHEQPVELLEAPGASEVEGEVLEQVAVVRTPRPYRRVVLAAGAGDTHRLGDWER